MVQHPVRSTKFTTRCEFFDESTEDRSIGVRISSGPSYFFKNPIYYRLHAGFLPHTSNSLHGRSS